METIQYKPLDPSKTEIRLIELFPTAMNKSTQRKQAPRCNLIHASLDDKPDYAAFSVSVTRNLHSALEHLQYDKEVRIIWIDALCINQSDNEEKSWQVQLMREIYQHATFVSIWLGPADTTSDKVMDFLNQLGAKAMGFGLDGGPDLLKEFGVLPDYTRSCPDAYISVAIALLRQGHLSALSLCQFPKVQLGLPSSVPDWSKPLRDTLQSISTDHMTPDPQFNASGPLLQKVPVFNGIGANMSVSLSGFIYDEVRDPGATWADLCSPEDTIDFPLIQVKRFLEELVRLSFIGENSSRDLKERISSAVRAAIAEIGYNDSGKWARTGNLRYHIAVSLMMIHVNSRSEINVLDSELLELIKSDGIQPGIDRALC
ncbi:hypothetical protein N431DRAFT_458641 [Stipitochalara longipes BDJ]|nr:hypothetical protein N431DRAFT_458641 [Stipitochalara longipes BDJ]